MELKQFWKKKEIFSYICAVMVFLRHCSTMANYSGFSDSMNILNTWIKYGVNGGVNTAFFILSGFLMFRNYTPDKGKEKIKKRMTSLGIPFVIWNILGMLFAIALSIPIFQRFLIGRQVFSFSIKNVFLGVFHFKYNTPFWFVFNLIFFALLTPVFDYLSQRKAISVISFLILTLCIKKYTLLPPFIFTVPQSILFYFAGVFIAKYCKNWFMSSCTKRESVFFLLVFLASTVYYTYYSLIGETSPFYRDIIIQIFFLQSAFGKQVIYLREFYQILFLGCSRDHFGYMRSI